MLARRKINILFAAVTLLLSFSLYASDFETEAARICFNQSQKMLSRKAGLVDLNPVKVIGEGAYGVVMTAQNRDGKLVAVKMLKMEAIADDALQKVSGSRILSTEDLRGRELTLQEARDGFISEHDFLSKLSFPGLPKTYGVYAYGGRYFIVMDLVRGQSVAELILNFGSSGLGELLTVRLGYKIAKILEYLQSQPHPILFLDIKPHNILTTGREFSLIDMGTAHELKAGHPTPNIGTPGYAPVEQYQKNAGLSTDIHALGITMRDMLFGEITSTTPLANLAGKAHPSTLTLLKDMTESLPANRIPNAKLLVKRFEKLIQELNLQI